MLRTASITGLLYAKPCPSRRCIMRSSCCWAHVPALCAATAGATRTTARAAITITVPIAVTVAVAVAGVWALWNLVSL